MSGRENAFELPIRFTYRPPKGLLIFLTTSHLGAIICLFLASVPAPILLKGLLSLIILFSCSFYLYSYHHAKQHPRQFILNANDEWLSLDISDREEKLRLLPAAFVHPLIVVMRFEMVSGKRLALLLTPSNCDPVVLRRLRVRLRYPHPSPDT